MKPLHVGLLVLGAALAGGLAVRMSQEPSVPVQVAVSKPIPEKPEPPKIVPVSVPAPTAVTSVTAAPPPVYAEPERVEPPAPKRKPFVEAPKSVVVAKVQPPMQMGPVTYHEPTVTASVPVKPPPAPVEPPPPEPVPAPTPEPMPELKPRQATLHQGMQVSIRLNQSLSTDNAAGGDTFQATLAEPLIADGFIVAERGARVTGRVLNAHKAGRLGGASELELSLSTLQTADGQRVNISTEPWVKQGEENLGSALGSLIRLSLGKPLHIPTDSLIRFRLSSRVIITERPL